MMGLDTNVVVRLLARDDAEQARRAEDLVKREAVWLSRTVLLETEWVLRFAYQQDAVAIHDAFVKLVGLPNVVVEDAAVVSHALAWYRAGLDFADALHLAACAELDGFASFDRKLRRKAGQFAEAVPVVLP